MNRATTPPSHCKEILPHLEAYLDGELAEGSLNRCIQNHVKKCSSCQAELDALKALQDQLRDLLTLAVSKRLSKNVGNLALDWRGSQRNRSSSLLPRRTALSFALSALSLMAVSLFGIKLWAIQDHERECHSARARREGL